MKLLIGKKIFVLGVMLEIAVVFLFYYPSLKNLFVWDDEAYIYYLPFVRESTFWLKAVTEPFFISTNYYRPLPLLTFMLDYRLGGGQPWLFHLINLLFHIVNTVLVVFLTQRVVIHDRPTTTQNLALLAGLFYGLHPVLVEPVAWISGRFDLMVTLFLLLALLLDGLPSLWKRSIGVGLCFFLAALCKEMAVAFPLVLVFWHLALVDRSAQGLGSLHDYWRACQKSGHLWVYLALLVAGLAYLGLRYMALGYLLQPIAEMDQLGEPLQHLLLVAKALGMYLSLIIWPFTQLSPLHEQVFPIPLSDISAWIALLVVTGWLVSWFWWVIRYPLSFWLGLACFVALAPVIHLAPLSFQSTIVHERFLTFPLALFTLLVASAIAQSQPFLMRGFVPRWRLPGIGIVTLTALWFGLSLVNIRVTVPLWKTSFHLWSWAAQKEPGSDSAKSSLMEIYINNNQLSKAKEIFEQINNKNVYTWQKYATIQLLEGKYEDSINLYQDVLANLPQKKEYDLARAAILNGIGLAWLGLKDLDKSEIYFIDSINTYPYISEAYVNIAEILMKKEKLDKSEQYLMLAKKYSYQDVALQKKIDEVANSLFQLKNKK